MSSHNEIAEPATVETNFAVHGRLRRRQQCEDTMPTFIRIAADIEEPAKLLSDELRAVALFGGIGLLVLLIAASTGVQGVWL